MAAPGRSAHPGTGVVQSETKGQLAGNAEDRTSQMVVCDPLQPDPILFCRLEEHFSKELAG